MSVSPFISYVIRVSLTSTISASSNTLCSGQSASLNATTNGIGTINWFATPSLSISVETGNGYITPTLSAGTYSYYAMVNSACPPSSADISMDLVNASPSTTLSVQNVSLCVGETAYINVAGAMSYLWSNGSTGTLVSVTPSVNSTYNFTGNGSNGCASSSSISLFVPKCTGIKNFVLNQQSFQIYPNPNNGEFNLQLNVLPENSTIEIYNSIGELVQKSLLISKRDPLKIENNLKGVYVVRILTVNRH